VYADSTEQLERLLGLVAPHPCLPVGHLNRGVNLLGERGRAVVEAFAAGFAGRVWGLVVHDKAEMAARPEDLVAALRALSARLEQRAGAPYLLLEYAAGLELEWFAELAERLRDAERLSFCIDIGHVGVRRARSSFAREHPGLDLTDSTCTTGTRSSRVCPTTSASSPGCPSHSPTRAGSRSTRCTGRRAVRPLARHHQRRADELLAVGAGPEPHAAHEHPPAPPLPGALMRCPQRGTRRRVRLTEYGSASIIKGSTSAPRV
jgi:hypothetical protein